MNSLIDDIKRQLNELDRFKKNIFHDGFELFYTTQLQTLMELVDSRGNVQITFNEYQVVDNKIKSAFAGIDSVFDSGGNAEEALFKINQARESIDKITNRGMRNFYLATFDAQKPVWEAKLANIKMNAEITDTELLKAFDLFQKDRDVNGALAIVNKILYSTKYGSTVKDQATYLNNFIINYMDKEVGKGKEMHVNFGKLSLYDNEQINNEVRLLYSNTRNHVQQQLAKLSQQITDEGENKKIDDLKFKTINELRDYIENKQLEGFKKLNFKHSMIEALPDATPKQKALEGIKTIEDWFSNAMEELMTTVNRYNDSVLYATYNNRKKALLQVYENELDDLLNQKQKGKLSDYTTKVQSKVNQILYGIDERMAEIENEIPKATNANKKRTLELEYNNLAAKREEFQQKGSIDSIWGLLIKIPN